MKQFFSGLESDTIGGFNSFIGKQSQMEGKSIISVVLFDDSYEILWDGIDADKVKLTEKEYFVRDSTALLDAIGKTILAVGYRLSKKREEDKPGKVIFVITTDGYENSSHEFTYKKVRELINHQQKKYNWDFIFLGANVDVAKEADNLGVCQENAFNYVASKAGMSKMFCNVSEIVSEKRLSKKIIN